jgi:hypothetical protein
MSCFIWAGSKFPRPWAIVFPVPKARRAAHPPAIKTFLNMFIMFIRVLRLTEFVDAHYAARNIDVTNSHAAIVPAV